MEGCLTIPFDKRERVILITVVVCLVAVNVIGYCRHIQWEREYSLIVREVTSTISINNATRLELESLPGIGPSLAQRIIEYREEHGGFRSTDEMKYIKGIGEKKFSAIEPFIEL